MKNILITGANGLIGRIVAIKLGHAGYHVFGVDINNAGTPSQRFARENNDDSHLLKEHPYHAYYQLDITQKYQFIEIIKKIGKIDCVIHLAALSDNETVENIKKVNEGGTEALFEICSELKIDNVILASSVMTVWGKLVDEKLYLQEPASLQKVSADVTCLPKDVSPPLLAYINSKIKIEQTAYAFFNGYHISSVCMRIGAVSSDNLPYPGVGLDTIWCSHADICSFTNSALEVLINKTQPFFGIYFVCSKSKNCWVDLAPAKTDFGYEPADSAEQKTEPPKVTVAKMPSALQQQIKLFGRRPSSANPATPNVSCQLLPQPF